MPFSNWQTAEQEFLRSADNLCELYGWTKPQLSGLSFPENIQVAYQSVLKQRPHDFGLQIEIAQDGEHACCLATTKTLDTGYHLFYVPARPLWRIKADAQERPRYLLWLALFAYLYQVAGLPFFNEPGTVGGNYETIENWLDEEDDGDEPFRRRQKAEIKRMEQGAKDLLPEVQKPFSLKQLETALRRYCKCDNADSFWLELADEFIKLIKDYPKQAIKDTMFYGEEPEDNNTLYWEQYISFYWSNYDDLAETFFQMINDEFQEMANQEEPISLQWFDKPQEKPCHTFDFEPRLFALIDRFSELLNDYDYETANQ